MRYSLAISLCAASMLLYSPGCRDQGTGTLLVQIYGEDFIEQGIDASEFADGWSVHFDHFCVNLGTIQAAGATFPSYRIFDLTRPGPTDVVSDQVDEGPIAPGAYRIKPADESSTNSNAPQDIVDLMETHGYALYVQGTATKDASTISFSWGFSTDTEYAHCHATGKVPDGGTGTMQITIHGDHLFMDSLVEMEPSLRFDAIAAADENHDGEVTLDELKAVSGTRFAALDHYDVDPDSGIHDLAAYLTYLSTTVGHIDGEGHCE